MTTYTSEENKELVETIKNPVRYYRVMLYGYGGESAYIGLNKEQFEYWQAKHEEDGDNELVEYVLDDEGEQEIDDKYAFLKDEEGYISSWYEAPTEAVHQYGVDYYSARITVEEVESDDYMAPTKSTIIDGQDLPELVEQYEDEANLIEMDVVEAEQPDYVCQVWSAEKGTFFDGVIETNKAFDPKKLKFYTNEYWNGDDTVESVEYDGTEIDNAGGDTNGKGYSAYVWSNK